MSPGARAPQQEKLVQWEDCTLQRRVAPALYNQGKPMCSSEDKAQPEFKKKKRQLQVYQHTVELWRGEETRFRGAAETVSLKDTRTPRFSEPNRYAESPND